MRRWIGRWLMGVGVVHAGFGTVIFAEPLSGILRDGVWNAVDGHAGRPLAFWFVFLGLFTIVFGGLVDWIESRGLRLPRRLGWGLSIVALLAIVTMPVGGGWLLLLPAVGALVRSLSREPKPG